jgi:putative endonuclease
MDTREKGREGEKIAAEYLKKNNYTIIEKNYYTRLGEIDIIAQDKKDEELVFVEVKARRKGWRQFGYPEDAIGETKFSRLTKTAQLYIWEKNYQGKYRFDCLAIEIASDGEVEIKHYKNIG